MTTQKLMYGMIAVGEDFIDEALEALETKGIPDETWDWMVWTNGRTYYSIIRSDLAIRGILAQIDGVKVVPLGVVSKNMSDNRNEWIEPEATESMSSITIAEETLHEWLMNLWTPSSNEASEPTIKSRRDTAAQTSISTVDAESEVMAAFGLDEMPEGITMYKFTDN